MFKVAWTAPRSRRCSRRPSGMRSSRTATRSSVQNLVVGSIGAEGVGNDPVKYDGFSECWFASREAYERSMETPEWKRLVEDGPNLLDMEALEQGMSAVVEERVIKPEPVERG